MTLTHEQIRILRASREGRMYTDHRGWWQIEGESPPITCERRRLIEIGLLHSALQDGALTEAGLEALEAA